MNAGHALKRNSGRFQWGTQDESILYRCGSMRGKMKTQKRHVVTVLGEIAEARQHSAMLIERAKEICASAGMKFDPPKEKNTIKIVVAGEAKAGKSTLINTMIGKKVAATGDIPTTSKAYSCPDTAQIN